MGRRMVLNPDFREFVESCVAREVRFLVVGGYALAAHGHPRLTKDLDVWVWIEPANASRMVAALADFGFGSVKLEESDFLEEGVVIQLGYPPNRIDLLTSIDGVDFEDAYPRRVEVDLGNGLMVPVIGVEDFRANKRASGRLQDLADIEALDEL